MKEKIILSAAMGVLLIFCVGSAAAHTPGYSSAIPAGGSNWMVMGAIILVVLSYLIYVYTKKRRNSRG
jgi:hypothetical protein